MKKSRIQLALVDDHQIVIDGLMALLKGHEKFCFAFATTDPTEVISRLEQVPVDILLTDVMMPRLAGNELARQVKKHVLQHHPDLEIEIVDEPEKEIGYYKGIQYKVVIHVNDRQFEIGDGGFVDWTQQLLQNKKERMFSTGFGFEFMYRILNGQV